MVYDPVVVGPHVTALLADASEGCSGAGVPRSEETPSPLGSPQVPGHRATVRSYGGGGSKERGIPVADVSEGCSSEHCLHHDAGVPRS